MAPHELGRQPRPATFDPGAVRLVACQPQGELSVDADGNVKGWHTWKNNNPEFHAVFEVQARVNGSPVTLDRVSGGAAERVDATTYRTEVGPEGAEATTTVWIPADEFPEGDSQVSVRRTEPTTSRGEVLAGGFGLTPL